VSRRALSAALALALLAALGACGKQGRPSAPESEESSYTYPQVYPKPSSVVPQNEEEAPKTGEAPTHAGGIKVFPETSRSTTIYDSGPIQ
jgi:predicted small lipoprotein YifL